MQDRVAIRITSTGVLIEEDWAVCRINLRLDTVASTAYFETLMTDSNRHLYRPGACTECSVEIYDDAGKKWEKLITGIIVNPGLSYEKKPVLNSITIMSKSGILENVPVPIRFASEQYINWTPYRLARAICDEYGVEVELHEGAAADANAPFEWEQNIIQTKGKGGNRRGSYEDEGDTINKPVFASPGESAKNFLSRICAERGITVSHDNKGRVLLYKILNVINADSEIIEKESRIFKISFAPDWQKMSSSVTVRCEADEEQQDSEGDISDDIFGGDEYTAYSPFHKGMRLLKPYRRNEPGQLQESDFQTYFQPAFVYAKTIGANGLRKYADSLVCKQVLNLPIIIEWDGFMLPAIAAGGRSRVVRAGFFLIIESPSNFINKTQFVVESMDFEKPEKGKPFKVTAKCVHPCAYTGVIPNESFITAK